MKKKIIMALVGSILFSALFAFLINGALIDRASDDQAAFESKNLLLALEQASFLKAQNLEKEIESLVSIGVQKQKLEGDLEQALSQNLLSLYVFDQNSRKSLWTWEGSEEGKLKEKLLVKHFGKQLFEGASGWMVLENKGKKYPMITTRRLLLFPESRTEKEVTIAAMVAPQFWTSFIESFSMSQGGLALYDSRGELMAVSSPEILRLQRVSGAAKNWLSQPITWQAMSSGLRVSSRPVDGGKIWLVNFSQASSRAENAALFFALFFIFLAFSLIIGGAAAFLTPSLVLTDVFANDVDKNIQDSDEVVSTEAFGDQESDFEEQVFAQRHIEVKAPSQLKVGEIELPRMNEQERFSLVKSIAKEVSRELIKPLTSILGHVQLGREIKQTENEHWNKIETEARQAKKFIENLRSVSGDLTFQKTKHSVTQILEGQLRRLHWKLDELHVRVESNISTKALILTDGYALEEALSALIVNAAEAQEGHRDKKIQVNAFDEDGRCVVEIIDGGDGVTEEIKAKIFEPFFSTKKEEGHNGLGLSLARAVFEAQGADFHFDSVQGEGTHILVKFQKIGEEQDLPSDLPAAKKDKAPTEGVFELDQEDLFTEKRLNEELSFIGDEGSENFDSAHSRMPQIPDEPLPKKPLKKTDKMTVEIRSPREKTE